MTQQAQPCPFCGARFRTSHDVSGRVQQLICMDCGARGPEVDRLKFAVEAERAWDRRACTCGVDTSDGEQHGNR